jgi:hypothetical protein
MTDTFANGPRTPGSSAANTTQQAGDVTSTLAELERKLRELESELSSIGRRRDLTGPAPGHPSAPASETRDKLVDEAIEPRAVPAPPVSIEPPRAPAPPVASTTPAEAGQPVKFVRPSEPRSVPQPQRAEQERPRPSEAQLASLAELRRFRDRLERFARDLAAEYDALLGRVMSGLTAAPTPLEPSGSTLGEQLAAGAPSAGDEPIGTRHAHAAPGAESATMGAETAPAETLPEDVLFEGRVELGVGPFYDIVSLSAFERRLASLPYVVEASVRRFEASHAVVDVRLAAPVALVRELRRTSESDFSVREVADGRVLLTFDDA